MATKRRSRRRNRGIALVEILIVVAIIALISSGIAVAATKFWGDSKIKMATSEVRNIRSVVRTYQSFSDVGDCPTFSDLVKAGHLEKGTRGKDPWGQTYKITCTENEIFVSSGGTDRKFGTADDISVPEPEKDPS